MTALDVVEQGRSGRPRVRGRVVLAVAAVVVALLVADRWVSAREVDDLFDRARDGRTAVRYADGRLASVLQYTNPTLLSEGASPAVRTSLEGLVTQAAADRVESLVRQRDAAAATRVVPWHRAARAARERWLAYLDARIAYQREVGESIDALFREHPQPRERLASARAAYARCVPRGDERVEAVFGPER